MILSIYGLNEYDPTIWNGFELPAELDRKTVVDSIVTECAELELLYPNAPYMNRLIRLWSQRRRKAWEELYKTTVLEYNPIWNKDGKTVETRDLTGSVETEGSDENAVSAFDEEGYHPESKQTSKVGTGTTDKGTVTRIEQGNIGLTSTQELIRQQRVVVEFTLIDQIVTEFKQRFCIMKY